MANIKLDPHQIKAVRELGNGKILKGGVGSGKSRVALAYYYSRELDGRFKVNGDGESTIPSIFKDLYIITTAKKRDSLEWEAELASFALSTSPEATTPGSYITIDSWNNIVKYVDTKDSFFIFDEQRLVGNGAWVKAFHKIAKSNRWIVLSATPGDDWMDYVPIFVANGFYKNRTEFTREHCVYNTWGGYPRIERFVNTRALYDYRSEVLVEMPYHRHTKRHLRAVTTEHDKEVYKRVFKDRWNVYEERPIKDAAELFRVMRRVVNQDRSRLDRLSGLLQSHKKLIVFYNFDYELEGLREFALENGVTHAEWNGHKHMPIPTTDSWLYLVQYTAGSEGWNCIETDAMVFYSLTYSYKQFEQAQGRIDRMNTPYEDLYYYVFRSGAMIDNAIWRALMRKESFNEKTHLRGLEIGSTL